MKFNQILLLSFALFGCTQTAEVKPTYLTEKIEYPSKNILGFENLFGDGLDSQKNVEIFGNLERDKTYGESGDNRVFSGHQTLDGGYIMIGYTKPETQNNPDILLIKTDSQGRVFD